MKIEKFRVTEGSKVNLKIHPTDFTGDYIDKKDALKDSRTMCIECRSSYFSGTIRMMRSSSLAALPRPSRFEVEK